jgi:ABC-type ATPase with predicted acetyltransferase domain
MARKTKTKRVVVVPEFRPDSFTRAALRKAIKKVAEARRRRAKPTVSDGSR